MNALSLLSSDTALYIEFVLLIVSIWFLNRRSEQRHSRERRMAGRMSMRAAVGVYTRPTD